MPFLGPLGGCWGCQWMRPGTVIYRMHCCHPPSAGMSPDASAGVAHGHAHTRITRASEQVLSAMTAGLQLLGL